MTDLTPPAGAQTIDRGLQVLWHLRRRPALLPARSQVQAATRGSAMPSTQLDVSAGLDPTATAELARLLGVEYARIMGADPRLMTVVVRDLPPGSIWHCTDGDPVPGTLLMCDVRAGRDRATRDAVARRLIDVVVEHCGVAAEHVKVEFTQHTGDEMFHQHLGGFNRDWSPDEGG